MKSIYRSAFAVLMCAAISVFAQEEAWDDAAPAAESAVEESAQGEEAVSEAPRKMTYEEEVAAEDRKAAKEYVSAKEFGRKLGRAKKDNMIEAGFSGGLANKLWAYDVAYTRVVFDGIAAVTFPITVWQTDDLPETTTKQKMRNGKNLLVGGGAKVRLFHNEIDEGLFYGLGGKIYLIWTEYERQMQGSDVWFGYKFFYQNFIPTSEIGYLYKFTPEFGILASAELGIKFSTYDELNNDLGGDNAIGSSTVKNPKGDPGRTPVFGDGSQWWYYTINVNLVYAF